MTQVDEKKVAVTPRVVRSPEAWSSSLSSVVTQQWVPDCRQTREEKAGLQCQHFIAIIQVFSAVYKCFIFVGPLQVCLNNVASARRPPHDTHLTLRTEGGSAHAQGQGPGYTIHSWKSCDICKLTGHPSKSGCPESQSLPQRPRHTYILNR